MTGWLILSLYWPTISSAVWYWASQVVLVIKNLPANAVDIRDVCSIPGLGRSTGEGNGNPLWYSCLENPMNRGAWQATDHAVARVGHDLATKPPPRMRRATTKRTDNKCWQGCREKGTLVCYWWECKMVPAVMENNMMVPQKIRNMI